MNRLITPLNEVVEGLLEGETNFTNKIIEPFSEFKNHKHFLELQGRMNKKRMDPDFLVDFSGSTFYRVDASALNFPRMKANNVKIINCNLENSNNEGSTFYDSEIIFSNLNQADFSRTHINKSVIKNVKANKLFLNNSIIANSVFEDVIMNQLVANNSQIKNSEFYKVIMESSDLKNSEFVRNIVKYSDMKNSDLKNCDVNKTDFSYSNLENVNFDHVKKFLKTKIFETGLKDANLGKTRKIFAYFKKANFEEIKKEDNYNPMAHRFNVEKNKYRVIDNFSKIYKEDQKSIADKIYESKNNGNTIKYSSYLKNNFSDVEAAKFLDSYLNGSIKKTVSSYKEENNVDVSTNFYQAIDDFSSRFGFSKIRKKNMCDEDKKEIENKIRNYIIN